MNRVERSPRSLADRSNGCSRSAGASREIIADSDPLGIWVYQAFRPDIADEALRLSTFGPRFSRNRMTWLKPSFGWMLYRSSYATADNQQRILRIHLRHQGFLEMLQHSAPSSFNPRLYAQASDWQLALRAAEARYQWDPDRDLQLRPLDRRALQLGIRGSLVSRYVDEWIIGVTDVTDLAHAVRHAVQNGLAPLPHVPDERPYPLPPEIASILGID